MQPSLALLGGTPVRSTPWPAWPVRDQTEEEAVLSVIRSGHWGRLTGTQAATFEATFSAAHGACYGVATPSGTIAIKLALLASGIPAGAEVIVPPYTFIATLGAVIECNGIPVFADIHSDSYCLDPARVSEAVTEKTHAIIAVHLGGMPADMEALRAIADAHGLVLIEDASHAHGAVHKGRSVGSWGDFACFSFQATKNLTGGEGGIALTSDETRYLKLRGHSDWGRLPASWDGDPILGGNYRMTELQAALLNAQWTRFPEQCAQRDKNGRYLDHLLAQVPGIRPLPREALGCDVNGYHLYVFRYDEDTWGIPRATFIRAMNAEGIPVQPGYSTPMYDWPLFTGRHFGPFAASTSLASQETSRAQCPVMERVSRHEGCWIKQGALLAESADMEQIAEAAQKVWDHKQKLAA